ncbi:vascular endothelial growth factor receptor 3-like [Dendronephthya gigantea]|uniref:vascular endothelial growth factor receptor 3-like n=1 Tax=Dendronephthya gigantea TaxID=151771 RepID=UPI001069828E|nr:vascular endothelial growth factor receptor 3-like [Dendronephthya gigantea]
MAESGEARRDSRHSTLDVEEDTETDVQDDPWPYDSDTEEVDIDSFVNSISHDVNDWKIYYADSFTLEKIGDGFFGDIYKAIELNTGRVLVMKAMKKVTKMKLMCAEIRLMARLKHPNILRFLGVCLDTSGIHLLTEYMEVGNLEDVVADDREALPWSLRMKLAHDISKGMSYLHSVGVIHRDLASKNVLISNESNGYTAVIADFGLAAKIPSRKKKLNVVGSPYWMAPEVLRNDQYNETVDIFSYGIILCEIIGRVHSSPDEIPRTNHFGLDVDKFCESVQGCPPEFLQLAVCCCQVDPQSRPPFEVTAKFLDYIRQFEIIIGSPTVLIQDTRNCGQRMSANIEDWIIDSKKSLETPIKNIPTCDEDCVCENGTSTITNGGSTDGPKTDDENKSNVDLTPCRTRHSNKRHSFFAGLRYKYFKPHVDTEDLVKNTPSKLAGFFNRVLHAQKKHKFDGRKKRRSKTAYGDVVDDRPRLRSFRTLLLTHKERSASDAHFSENVLPRGSFEPDIADLSAAKLNGSGSYASTPVTTYRPGASASTPGSCTSSYVDGKFPEGSFTPKRSSFTHDEHTPTASSSRTSFSERRPSDPPSECTGDYEDADNRSSCENDDPYLMTWSGSSFRESIKGSQRTDMNGFKEMKQLPRCFSESDVEALKVTTSDRTKTFTPRHSPQKTKHKRNWNIFSFFHRRGKEKQNV